MNVQLVMSKNRVAPTKRVALPRLELLAAFILSKLLKFVLESLKVTVDRIVCWSDSLVELSWIRRPSRNWKKILGKAFLTYVEMYTVLTEIESTVNSRPLTFVGESIKDGQVITPAHLALGRALKTVPDIPHGTQCEAPINDRYLYRQRLIGHFWKR